MEASIAKKRSELSWQIGKILKAYRIHSGKTQAQLAQEAGVSQGAISHVEKGRRCQIDTVERIARALGYPLSQIIQRAEQMDNINTEDLKRRYLDMRKRHLGR